MTDKEIIEALKNCGGAGECQKCPLNNLGEGISLCIPHLTQNTLDLINRQNAEIERLKLRNGLLTSERELHKIGASKLVLKHRAEAIKGFAEMLKGEYIFALLKDGSVRKIIPNYAIDYVVKEMVGE